MRTCEYLLFKAENVGKGPAMYSADTDVRGDLHARESRKDLLFMAGDMHARELKKDGSRKRIYKRHRLVKDSRFTNFHTYRRKSTDEQSDAQSIHTPIPISRQQKKDLNPWHCRTKHDNG